MLCRTRSAALLLPLLFATGCVSVHHGRAVAPAPPDTRAQPRVAPADTPSGTLFAPVFGYTTPQANISPDTRSPHPSNGPQAADVAARETPSAVQAAAPGGRQHPPRRPPQPRPGSMPRPHTRPGHLCDTARGMGRIDGDWARMCAQMLPH